MDDLGSFPIFLETPKFLFTNTTVFPATSIHFFMFFLVLLGIFHQALPPPRRCDFFDYWRPSPRPWHSRIPVFDHVLTIKNRNDATWTYQKSYSICHLTFLARTVSPVGVLSTIYPKKRRALKVQQNVKWMVPKSSKESKNCHQSPKTGFALSSLETTLKKWEKPWITKGF